MFIVSFYQFKMKTCVIKIARVITQMAKRAGILSRVMSDGLRSHDIESEARMAWKFACSSKLIRLRTPSRGSKTSGAVIRKTLPMVDDPFNIRNCIKWAWRTFPEIAMLRLIHIHLQPGLRLFTLRSAISSSILLCMAASKYSREKKQKVLVLSYLLLGIYSSQDQASWVSFYVYFPQRQWWEHLRSF